MVSGSGVKNLAAEVGSSAVPANPATRPRDDSEMVPKVDLSHEADQAQPNPGLSVNFKWEGDESFLNHPRECLDLLWKFKVDEVEDPPADQMSKGARLRNFVVLRARSQASFNGALASYDREVKELRTILDGRESAFKEAEIDVKKKVVDAVSGLVYNLSREGEELTPAQAKTKEVMAQRDAALGEMQTLKLDFERACDQRNRLSGEAKVLTED